MEKTLAIIKPGFLQERKQIKEIIIRDGFNILKEMPIKLSLEDAQTFYAEHKNKVFFQEMTEYAASDQVLVLLLEKENAVEHFRNLIGATDPSMARIGTIRNLLGKSIQKNVIHGSDSQSSAEREIDFFFGLYD